VLQRPVFPSRRWLRGQCVPARLAEDARPTGRGRWGCWRRGTNRSGWRRALRRRPASRPHVQRPQGGAFAMSIPTYWAITECKIGETSSEQSLSQRPFLGICRFELKVPNRKPRLPQQYGPGDQQYGLGDRGRRGFRRPRPRRRRSS